MTTIKTSNHYETRRKGDGPRDASTYRGARRNADRAKGWPSATFAKSRPLAVEFGVRLNRSRHLPRATSYARAAEISKALLKAA